MRIGIVGTAWWAQLVHGPAAKASPDWELTTVYGRSADRAEALASALSCGFTTDVDELLDSVDALALAVPPQVQAELAVRAADAGKHLLLEKPLALDVAGAAEVVDAVEKAGVASQVFFTALWMPAVSSWLDETAARGGWESGRYEHLARLSDELAVSSPWRSEHGALWDVGPHGLSVLERVLGRVTEVSAVRGVRDHVHLTLRHGELSSSAELTLTAPEPAVRTRFSFIGPEGEATPTSAPDAAQVAAASSAALAELADQARTGRRGGVDAAYGAHVVEVLAAAERSLESGRVEAL